MVFRIFFVAINVSITFVGHQTNHICINIAPNHLLPSCITYKRHFFCSYHVVSSYYKYNCLYSSYTWITLCCLNFVVAFLCLCKGLVLNFTLQHFMQILNFSFNFIYFLFEENPVFNNNNGHDEMLLRLHGTTEKPVTYPRKYAAFRLTDGRTNQYTWKQNSNIIGEK